MRERERKSKNRARTGGGGGREASNLFFLPETRKPRRETLEKSPLFFFCSRFPFENESCALSLCFFLKERDAMSGKNKSEPLKGVRDVLSFME